MEPEPGRIVGLPSFPPILWLKVPFSLVQPSSHLTLCLYAVRSAHPNILIGTDEIRIPLASQSGSFCREFFSFSHLIISRADIPCVLENVAGEAARSTQPVTLYITVNITPPNLYNNPPSIPAEDDDSPAKEATIPGRIQFPVADPPLRLPVRTGTPMPQSREGMLPTEDFLFVLDRANEAIKLIVPIDRSTTWERTVENINWVMDTLSPIAEVRLMPFWCP